jgi:hypothetical protein
MLGALNPTLAPPELGAGGRLGGDLVFIGLIQIQIKPNSIDDRVIY